MKSAFERALDFVLEDEIERDKDGNVTWEKVPGDRGGVTKYGIDSRSHPKVDIKGLSLEDATAIYYNEYWSKISGPRLPEQLAIVTFDIAVLNGIGCAAKMLQRAIGGLKVDGQIGPRTIAAANAAGPGAVTKLLNLRAAYLREIAANNPSQNKFLKGWLARNTALKTEALA